MTIRQAIAHQRKTVKNLTAKEKLLYFWEYYGLKTICILIVVATVLSFVIFLASKKDYAYFSVFFGANPQAGSADFLQAFAETAQIDTQKHNIAIQASFDVRMDDQMTEEAYEAMQYFVTLIAAQMVDNFAADKDLFLYYGYLGYAADLRSCLDDGQLAQLAPYLHYIDGDLLRQQAESDEGLVFEYGQYPDSKNPEAMIDPIPVGIEVTAATTPFQDSYAFASAQTLLGIGTGTEHPEAVLSFLKFIFDIA